MTGHTRRFLALMAGLYFVVLASAPSAQEASPPAQPPDPVAVQRVDEYMQAEMRVNGFAGTVLLARKGTPIVAKGYGLANAEWDVPNTPRTKFRLGS